MFIQKKISQNKANSFKTFPFTKPTFTKGKLLLLKSEQNIKSLITSLAAGNPWKAGTEVLKEQHTPNTAMRLNSAPLGWTHQRGSPV